MREPLRVFIGSSREALVTAQDLQDLLFQEGGDTIAPRGWWLRGVFRVGETFIESLERVMKETDAAILVATEDDQTTIRGEMKTQPRDNITFECGMAISTHGRKRTALAVLGDPKLPTDLDGVHHLLLEPGRDSEDFKERNRAQIKALIQQWSGTNGEGDVPPAASVPDTQLTSRVPVLLPTKARLLDEVATADKEDALMLVAEIKNHHDDLLGKTNLVRRYKINRIAVSKLCEEMNRGRQRGRSSERERLTKSHLVTVDEYKTFEKKTRWRCLGYGMQTAFESEDGTKAISGVSDAELEQMKRGIPADPYSAILTDGSAASEAIKGISWYDAVAYCSFVRGRLPTRQELATASREHRFEDVWEWTQTWLDERIAHIAVLRNGGDRGDVIGVNPDLRLLNLGFRVII